MTTGILNGVEVTIPPGALLIQCPDDVLAEGGTDFIIYRRRIIHHHRALNGELCFAASMGNLAGIPFALFAPSVEGVVKAIHAYESEVD